MEIKRHFYNKVDYFLDEDAQVVKLSTNFHQKLLNKKLWNRFGFKKIGGSAVGDVLLSDQYKSQFNAFARVAWLSVPILDRKYVDAGIAIEPKVIKVIEDKTGKTVQTFDPQTYNFDYFASVDPVVGGIPDGFIPVDQRVIEIKTTGLKNLEKWNKLGVPTAYVQQAQLYAHLMKATKYSIVATFLKEQDYVNPENFPIEKRKVKSWTFNLESTKAQDNIWKIKTWYAKYTTQGVSPKYDLSKDHELLEWLRCENKQEWEALQHKWTTEGKIK